MLARRFRAQPWLAALLALAAAGPAPAASPVARSGRAHAAADTSVTTVFVVRHAEKNTDWMGPDPPLTEAGRKRAAELARVLADAHVGVIYTTNFLRTRATAEPLAAATGDSIEVVDQGKPQALAERIWNRDRGRSVLIVGHSDTVPAIVRSLGGRMPEPLSESFDLMIVITRRGAEPPHMVRLRYGAP